jgi:hypothetical protein
MSSPVEAVSPAAAAKPAAAFFHLVLEYDGERRRVGSITVADLKSLDTYARKYIKPLNRTR